MAVADGVVEVLRGLAKSCSHLALSRRLPDKATERVATVDSKQMPIAITKANVIALFFMHIKGSSRLLHLAALAGVMWLLILISLTLSDYFTRGAVSLNH